MRYVWGGEEGKEVCFAEQGSFWACHSYRAFPCITWFWAAILVYSTYSMPMAMCVVSIDTPQVSVYTAVLTSSGILSNSTHTRTIVSFFPTHQDHHRSYYLLVHQHGSCFRFLCIPKGHDITWKRLHYMSTRTMSLCTELCSSRVTKLVLVVSESTHQLLRYEGAAIYGHFCYLWLQYVSTSYWAW